MTMTAKSGRRTLDQIELTPTSTSPSFDALSVVVDRCLATVRAAAPTGKRVSSIPALAQVNPEQLGIAIAGVDGSLITGGDSDVPFSVQSISKLFALCQALSDGAPALWSRIDKEPSGDRFDSLILLESEEGRPRNPFINAGALLLTDHLRSSHGDASTVVLDLLRREAANPSLDVDPVVAASERDGCHRNAALAHYMASCGTVHGDVPDLLDQYTRMCAISASCVDLARAGVFLARAGVGRDGRSVLPPMQARRVNALMLTCGMYDAAGDFAYRVGLPGKSGVGGGVLAVVPGRCAVCVWSPRLDTRGNSSGGVNLLEELVRETGWSIF
jgi:glutaminase